MTSIEQHINHYLEVGTNLRVPMKQHLASPGEEVTMATLPRVNLRHLSHWSSQWNRLQLPHTYPYIHLRGVGGWDKLDRIAVCEAQHGNHATQMCPMSHWATMYIQPTVHVTQRHSYLHQSRHRDSATLQCSTPPKANAMHRHSYLHHTHSRDMVTAILQRLSGAPSQLIPLVLVTGPEIPFSLHYQDPRYPRGKPSQSQSARCYLRRLAHRAFATSLSPSR